MMWKKTKKATFVRTFVHMTRVWYSVLVTTILLKFNLHKNRKLTCWSIAGFLNWNTSQICKYTEIMTMNHTSQVIDGCGCILSWGLKPRPMICRQIRLSQIQAQVCHLKTQQPVCWQQTLQQPLASNCNIYVKRRKKSNQTNHESWVTSKLLTHCLELDSRVASVQRFTTGKFVQSWHVGFIGSSLGCQTRCSGPLWEFHQYRPSPLPWSNKFVQWKWHGNLWNIQMGSNGYVRVLTFTGGASHSNKRFEGFREAAVFIVTKSGEKPKKTWK